MTCAICGIRKPKRYCPAVRGEICTICCGTEREQTIDCPVTCEYLREAHDHEKKPAFDPATFANQDIEITDSFLEENQFLMLLLGAAAADGAMATGKATDYDIREALDSLISTYRALQSGLYYEALPPNPYAASIHAAVQACVARIRKTEIEDRGSSTLRDATILGVLVSLHRFESTLANGRKRSRAFLDFLLRLEMAIPEAAPQPEKPLIAL